MLLILVGLMVMLFGGGVVFEVVDYVVTCLDMGAGIVYGYSWFGSYVVWEWVSL